jgi:hypothetical protein
MRPLHAIIYRCEKGCCVMAYQGRRDPKTGRVFGFQSETQRQNFMIGRARCCNGPNREMPRCTALTRLGEPCKAARMGGRSTCFRHSGSAVAKRARLTAAHLSGDLARVQRAEMRSERNRLRTAWRHDPCEPGKTIILVPKDEEICRAWAIAAWLPVRTTRSGFSGIFRYATVVMGAAIARFDQRRRLDRQTCAIAQPDHGDQPCRRSFVIGMGGSCR